MRHGSSALAAETFMTQFEEVAKAEPQWMAVVFKRVGNEVLAHKTTWQWPHAEVPAAVAAMLKSFRISDQEDPPGPLPMADLRRFRVPDSFMEGVGGIPADEVAPPEPEDVERDEDRDGEDDQC